MMKKFWRLFVLRGLMMVAGCSGKRSPEKLQTVSVETSSEDMEVIADADCDLDKDASEDVGIEEPASEENSDKDVETDIDCLEQETSSDKEKEPADLIPVVTEEPTAEPPTTEQPSTPQPTPETDTPEPTTSEPSTEAETDEGDNSADGSPITEITIDRPEAEYVEYDPNRVQASP